MLNLEDVNRLLDPSPMSLEMGYERLSNGVLHVAVRTDLHKCTVGSIHVVEEYFSGMPAEKLLIQFRDSREFFDADLYEQARSEGNISAALSRFLPSLYIAENRDTVSITPPW